MTLGRGTCKSIHISLNPLYSKGFKIPLKFTFFVDSENNDKVESESQADVGEIARISVRGAFPNQTFISTSMKPSSPPTPQHTSLDISQPFSRVPSCIRESSPDSTWFFQRSAHPWLERHTD